MNDPLKHLNCIEKAVTMRVASLALSNAIHSPDRTLRECLLEEIDRIPYIIEEHCKGMRIEWWDQGHPFRGEHWGDYALDMLTLMAMYAEDIVDGRSSPAEARAGFRRHAEVVG